MFDGVHLGHGVRDRNQLRGAASPGDNDMHVGGPCTQCFNDHADVDPAVEQWVGQLIEHHKKMLTACERLCRQHPAGTRQLCRTIQIPALPAKSIAETLEGNPELLQSSVFSEACDADLHELEEADRLAAPVCTHREADRRCGLTLAVARVDDQQTATLPGRFLVGFLPMRCLSHLKPPGVGVATSWSRRG